MVNIKGLDKAKVLKALWRGSHEQGMSFLGAFINNPTLDECLAHLKKCNYYVDYFNGRVIKCDLKGDSFDERLYDRDCGDGAAAYVILRLREEEAVAQANSGQES